MGLLMISHSSGFGGAETIFLEVFKVLEKQNKNIIISLPKEEGKLHEYLKGKKIFILKNFTIYGSFFKMFFKFFLRDIFYLRDFFKYIKIIKKNNIEVIYTSSITNIQGLLLSKFLKKKHIWHIHEMDNESFKWFDKRFDFLYKKFFLSSELIFINDEVLNSWVKRFKVDKNNLDYKIINNPLKDLKEVSKNLKSLNEKEIVIGYLGSNDTNKNLVVLVKSFKKMLLKSYSVKLMLVGKNMKKLEVQFEEVDKKKYDLCEYMEAQKFYNMVDVVVIPSLNESWSLSAMEALYCNIPTILTNKTPLINYIKDEENIIFFNPKSEEDLIKKLEKITKNYEYYYKKFKVNNKAFFLKKNYNRNFKKNIIEVFERKYYEK